MMTRKGVKDYIGITLRGMGMGAADVVPGVSGGTIAFITGIYEELIGSLANINGAALKTLFSQGLAPFWKQINGNFFIALFLGIGISVFSLAKGLTYLLDAQPVLLWSFFFGLVLASAILIIKTIPSWSIGNFIGLIIGTGIAVYISMAQAGASEVSLPYIFLSGCIAICAMILPGISGAFILVLMGSYAVVIEGIKDINITIILVFGGGCIVGLLAFSKLLKYLFENYKSLVLAILTGFLFGSLVKIWPWKNEILDQVLVVHSDGKIDYAMQHVLPNSYIGEAQLAAGVGMFLFGLILVLGLEFAGKKYKK
jgi:putative membrane protein